MYIMLLLHLLSAGLVGGDNSSQNTRFVRVEASLADTLLRAGSKGTILVSFTPADGIHVTADPPVAVRIERNRLIRLHGRPDISTDKDTGFLSTTSPVEQAFSVSRAATPGAHQVKGTIVYYFCSDTEGWCRKQSQAVTFTLNIQGR